jgi:hypothetical protein
MEKNDREIVWDIPQLELEIPPQISLHHDISYEEGTAKLHLSVNNQNGSALNGVYLEVTEKSSATEAASAGRSPVLSGPTLLFLNLPGQTTVENIIYTIREPVLVQAKVIADKRLLAETMIVVDPQASQPHRYSKEKRIVAVGVVDHRERPLKIKNGYYQVSANQEIKVTINSKGPEYVGTVQEIELKHPNISVGSTGKGNDRTFSYDMKFLINNPLTTKLDVLYSVKYQDAETRTQVLPLQVKASRWGLFLIGMLFILPNVIDMLMTNYELGKHRDIWLGLLLTCIFLPFLYDRIQSRF